MVFFIPGIVLCEADDMEVRVFKVKNVEADTLYPVFEHIKSSDGKVTVHSATSNIIVKDYPENIAQMESIFSQMDKAQKQMRVDVRIIDAGKAFLEEAGLVSRKNILSPGEFHKVIALAKKDKETSIDSTMSVLTLSGKPARLQIGEKRITGGTVEAHKGVIVVVPQQETAAGNSLEVIPRANPDGKITVVVKPSMSEFRGKHTKFDRSIITRVIINDGETLVLGGVNSAEDGRETLGIPFIGAIGPGKTETIGRRIIMYITVTADM